jgi:hypothetical protein
VPEANLYDLDLTRLYLIDANLTNASLHGTTLSTADMTNANLTKTNGCVGISRLSTGHRPDYDLVVATGHKSRRCPQQRRYRLTPTCGGCYNRPNFTTYPSRGSTSGGEVR